MVQINRPFIEQILMKSSSVIQMHRSYAPKSNNLSCL